VWKDGQKNSLAGLWRSDPFVFDLRNWLRQGEVSLRNFGIPRKLTDTWVRPLEESLAAFEDALVRAKNR
jgi:hypothetical protein